jgi:translation elongation factor EF-1beta
MAAIADRFAVLAAELVANLASSQAQLLEATKQMQETQMSFNLQYLQLQSQMQHENRAFTAVSNIMKTKHDTVKNSISNIR